MSIRARNTYFLILDSVIRYNRSMKAVVSRATNHLKVAEALTDLLENRFALFGFRFGLDAVIGLIPWIGDVVTTILSIYLVWIGIRMRLPEEKITRMIGNVVFDFLIGLIPVAGDLADIVFRANTRNLQILHDHLDRVIEKE